MRTAILFICFCFTVLEMNAQKEKLQAKSGNEEYRSGRYDNAIEEYTDALASDPEYMEVLFNTGNALQQKARRLREKSENAETEEEKKKFLEEAKATSEKAASQFTSVAKMAKTNEEVNKVQYNLGNSRLMSGDIDASIEAYKEALRKVPSDDDARYNLAYAQHMKKQQEQQQQQQQDQKQDNQEQNQDEQQEQQEQQEDQEKKEQEQQQQLQQQLSKEEAEQLLQALMKQEKDLQEDLKKKKQKTSRVRIEKDW